MDAATAWAEAMKFENRPNPYPYFDELRKTPVAKVSEKTYVVTGYPEAVALAHDPRISSDIARSPSGLFGEKETHLEPEEAAQARDSSMLVADPPAHDRMREFVAQHRLGHEPEALGFRIVVLVDMQVDADAAFAGDRQQPVELRRQFPRHR